VQFQEAQRSLRSAEEGVARGTKRLEEERERYEDHARVRRYGYRALFTVLQELARATPKEVRAGTWMEALPRFDLGNTSQPPSVSRPVASSYAHVNLPLAANQLLERHDEDPADRVILDQFITMQTPEIQKAIAQRLTSHELEAHLSPIFTEWEAALEKDRARRKTASDEHSEWRVKLLQERARVEALWLEVRRHAGALVAAGGQVPEDIARQIAHGLTTTTETVSEEAATPWTESR